jgi:hypothetical protein
MTTIYSRAKQHHKDVIVVRPMLRASRRIALRECGEHRRRNSRRAANIYSRKGFSILFHKIVIGNEALVVAREE